MIEDDYNRFLVDIDDNSLADKIDYVYRNNDNLDEKRKCHESLER